MSAINYTFVEQNNQQTTTASFATVSGMSISSSFFTAGKKYLILTSVQTHSAPGTTTNVKLKLRHGTTDFTSTDSDVNNSANVGWAVYSTLVVWTAVSSEGVDLQVFGGANDGIIDRCALFVMNLSDDLVENTDWFYNETTASQGLSTTPANGGTITFTPGTAGNDWLVLSTVKINSTDQTNSIISTLARSGEASSSAPSWRILPNQGANNSNVQCVGRAFSLGNVSNTFTEQSSMSAGTSATRVRSAVFAINLNKFKDHAVAYTDADVNLGTGSYGTALQTLSITPSVTGDVWMGSYWGYDRNNAGGTPNSHWRLQLDNADQPAGQTADAYGFALGDGSGDEEPYMMTTLANLSNASHTLDLDGDVASTTNAPSGQHRQLWAVTMELAAGGGGASADLMGQICL